MSSALKQSYNVVEGDEQMSRALRGAFGQFATGVTIVTGRTDSGEDIGITANSFSSVSLDPPLLLWSIALTSQNLRSFCPGFRFAVNVLSRQQVAVARHFARSGTDQFQDMPVAAATTRGLGDVPLFDEAIAVFECVLEQVIPAGDHNILIGRIERFAQNEGAPLAFHGGRFVSVDVG